METTASSANPTALNLQRAVVISSGWVEVFTNRPLPDRFLAMLQTEVFKWVLRDHSEAQAIQAAAVMQRGMLVDLDSRLAIAAAQLSHTLRLPMAESIILTNARVHQARLYTMDADFKDLHDADLMTRS